MPFFKVLSADTLKVTCELYHNICPLSWLLTPYWMGRWEGDHEKFLCLIKKWHIFFEEYETEHIWEMNTTTNYYLQINFLKRSFNELVRVFKHRFPETLGAMEGVSHRLFNEYRFFCLSAGKKVHIEKHNCLMSDFIFSNNRASYRKSELVV